MIAVNLKCEYLTNPAISDPHPRLSWTAFGGIKQTAYIVQTYKNGVEDWCSGKVETSSMVCVYGGDASPRDEISYTVTLFDENGKCGEPSDLATFEMGLLPSDWTAKWISGNYTPSKRYRYPVDYFRKIFNIKGIKKAKLYITAHGFYEAHINGKRVGNFELAPGCTLYTKRLQYQIYDVTDLLSAGKNEMTIALADGWYRGANYGQGMTYMYTKETAVLAQLEIYNSRGERQVIGTNDTFEWCNNGPLRYADNKDGEIVDANLSPSYDNYAIELDCHYDVLTLSENYPVTKHERFTPTLITTPSGKKVLDFGQNLSGFVGFKVNAERGQTILMKMGETLDKNGEFTQANFMHCVIGKPNYKQFIRHDLVVNQFLQRPGRCTPLQRVKYTCKDGVNEYCTKFSTFGFRYALIETDIEINPSDFYSVAVYSDFAITGRFDCSHPLINKFVDCTLWSQKSNSTDLPTDCPTRERAGWSGDAQVFFGTAAYLTAHQPFARKYIRDLRDMQPPRGEFFSIAPNIYNNIGMRPFNGSVGWADAGVIIPYKMWKVYGDDKFLSDCYESMKRYARFMMRRCGKGWAIRQVPINIKGKYKKYLVTRGIGFGEWAEPSEYFHCGVCTNLMPHPEESTAYTSYVMTLMTEIAEHLGKTEDAVLYKEYAEGTKHAYRELIKKSYFRLDTDRQAKLVRPLYMNLLDEEQTEYAQKRLLQALKNYGWRLGTGFLSTPFIMYVLSDIDIESAYKLLENEDRPGWLFMPKNGATTVWESWDGVSEAARGISSLNHYSKGAVCEWLFSGCAGINVAGENKFSITPKPGGTLTYARAEYDSVYGTVKSAWEKANGKTTFTITVPANCTATVTLPNAEPVEVTAGEHSWTI